jgi:MFS family permease
MKIAISFMLLLTGGGLIGYFFSTSLEIPWWKWVVAFALLGLGGALIGPILNKRVSSDKTPRDITNHYNKWLYGTFLLLGLYQLFFVAYADGMGSLAIALAFDPFNSKQAWSERPIWQRIWLLIHLAIVLTMFVLLFIADFGQVYENGIWDVFTR